MTTKHIIYIIIIVLLGIQISNAQFFKYSTFYTSMSMNTSMTEDQDYIAVSKGYEETTEINPYDYNLTIGIRKIARFDYEQKLRTWYYGTEQSVGDNTTIGNNIGWEYLFNFSFIRNRGEVFNSQDFWLRYLGSSLVAKIQYKDNQRVNLRYTSADFRYRVNAGKLDFTFGVCARTHPVYHINPIEDFWVNGESSFQELAEDFGYSTEFVQGRWHWFNDGELIATSNDEFFKHYFGNAVASYNERELEKLGMVSEVSLVFGTAYYKYSKDFWLHSWINILPYHYGINTYSHEYNNSPVDVDLGLITGWKLTKSLGIFVEGNYMKYWDKPVYEWTFGFNYLIF
jgi:hypothetical protein